MKEGAQVTTILGLIFVSIILFLIMANFSEKITKYECSGEQTIAGKTMSPLKVFIKISQYRWWVHLWGDSDGHLNLEIPNTVVKYYPNIKIVGDQIQIFEYSRKLSDIQGNFSNLSMTLALSISSGWFFDGKCELRQ